MKAAIVLVLLNFLRFPVLVLQAPTPEQPPTFRKMVEQTSMMVHIVLDHIPKAHKATVTMPGLTHDSPSHSANLSMMAISLDIPDAPVIKVLSDTFTQDMCVSRMSAGIQLFQDLVGVLSDKLSGLENLKSLLRDLKLRMDKIKEVGNLSSSDGTDQKSSSDLANRLDDDYNAQIAAHLTLTKFESFCHDMVRSLRKMESTNPRASAATKSQDD